MFSRLLRTVTIDSQDQVFDKILWPQQHVKKYRLQPQSHAVVDQGEDFPDIQVKEECTSLRQLTDIPELEEGLRRSSAFSHNRKQLPNPLSAVSCIFSSRQGHRGEQCLYVETFSPFHTW